MTVTPFDPSLCAYMVGGVECRLGAPAAPTPTAPTAPTEPGDPVPPAGHVYTEPTVDMVTVTNGRVTNAEIVVGGDIYNVIPSGIKWDVTPSRDTNYSSTKLSGAKAKFRHGQSAAGESKITATIPRRDGKPAVVVSATVAYKMGNVAGTFPISSYRGGDVKVEDSFGFASKRTVTMRLVRVCSPGVPTETTVIETRDVTFEANKAQVVSKTINHPDRSDKGAGYQYRWEALMAPGHTVWSDPLPIWVIGSAAPDPTVDSTPQTLNYPAVYQRKAANAGVMTPLNGKTYQDHLNKWIYDWRSLHFQYPLGGAWLSINDYYGNLHYVDLDDPTIPRYRFQHWDVWEWGYTLSGWYGKDASAQPFQKNQEAIDVPIPDYARPAIGTDRSLCIVGMRGGQVVKIWDMWLAQKMGDGSWRSSSIGTTTAAQNWTHSRSYTTSASGLSAAAYALRVIEAKRAVAYVKAERAAGRVPSEDVICQMVPHALAANLPNPFNGGWVWPATYSDGFDNNPATAKEGQLVYFRQDANIAAANLTPLKHVIAVVIKRYGIRPTDKTFWSTTLIVEGDWQYGGGQWSSIMQPGEDWGVKVPDDWWVLGKQYQTQAEWDADTR